MLLFSKMNAGPHVRGLHRLGLKAKVGVGYGVIIASVRREESGEVGHE